MMQLNKHPLMFFSLLCDSIGTPLENLTLKARLTMKSPKDLQWNILQMKTGHPLSKHWSGPKYQVGYMYLIRPHIELVFMYVPYKCIFLQANCLKNKTNHSKVKFQQTTGSRSYIAHCEALVNSCHFLLFSMPYYCIYIDLFQIQGKACADRKEPELNAVQIFKDCHTNKMKGMSTLVEAVVVSPYSPCL